MTLGSSSHDQIVRNPRITAPTDDDDNNIALTDNDSTSVVATTGEDDSIQQQGISDRIFPPSLRDRASRQIHTAGRHFNILDRLFQRSTQDAAHLQHGANYDGVFSNLSAKPDGEERPTTDSDNPPSYDEAAVDMAPSYYGVDDGGSGMYYNEICIEGLPVGNIANLIWNVLVSSSFQFIGFLVTYILHTSHAARQGSRLGLGITFLGYAYSMIPNDVQSKVGKDKDVDRFQLSDPNEHDDLHLYSSPATQDEFTSQLSSGLKEEKHGIPAVAVLTGLFGFFIVVKSLYDYVQIKRMERKYMSQDQASA